eukprot:COSAG06_NODE_5399_length_3505_cov_610.081914_2_plen_113_part_00
MIEVMVDDRLAITGAVWPSPVVTAVAKRRLGLVALPRDAPVSKVKDAEDDGVTTTTVTFAAWKLQTKAFSARLPHIDEARGEKKDEGGRLRQIAVWHVNVCCSQLHWRARSH